MDVASYVAGKICR